MKKSGHKKIKISKDITLIVSKEIAASFNKLTNGFLTDGKKYFRPSPGVTYTKSCNVELFDEENYIDPIYLD